MFPFLWFQIKASGVNFVELMCRQGLYPHCPRLPAVLGLEGAGVIIRTGKDVNHLKVRPAHTHTHTHTQRAGAGGGWGHHPNREGCQPSEGEACTHTYRHTHTHTHTHTGWD